jgi:hypothetical protein
MTTPPQLSFNFSRRFWLKLLLGANVIPLGLVVLIFYERTDTRVLLVNLVVLSIMLIVSRRFALTTEPVFRISRDEIAFRDLLTLPPTRRVPIGDLRQIQIRRDAVVLDTPRDTYRFNIHMITSREQADFLAALVTLSAQHRVCLVDRRPEP